jgi:hypothetical protein
MADLKDKQIRLVGSKDFAYATGSSYTQGHVHFTTDEHGSIVVNGKVYGTTDASYVYVGSENIPTYVANAIANVLDLSYEYTDNTLELSYAYTNAKINALDGKTGGSGNFVAYVKQENGIVTANSSALQNLVTVDNSEAKAYAPKGVNENVKFIKSFEIEGDTIIPKYDYFANNLPDVPNVTVVDNNTGYYLPEFSASGHTITVTNGAQVTSYEDFKGLKEVVDTFFGGAELDTEGVKSYIDTLAEIQEAFKNSYAEGIANSVNNIKFHGNNTNTSYHLWITYTTNGNSNSKQTAYVDILYGTDTAYGLVKYDDRSIKKNTNGQLYVNGELTDTKYSLDARSNGPIAYIDLIGTDGTRDAIAVKGTGIATVSYNSTNKFIEINVPETNYNHHTDRGGAYTGNTLLINVNDADNYVVTSVNLSADGSLSYKYSKVKHGNAGVTNTYGGKNLIPTITINNGHITAVSTQAVDLSHDHDEFVWL